MKLALDVLDQFLVSYPLHRLLDELEKNGLSIRQVRDITVMEPQKEEVVSMMFILAQHETSLVSLSWRDAAKGEGHSLDRWCFMRNKTGI